LEIAKDLLPEPTEILKHDGAEYVDGYKFLKFVVLKSENPKHLYTKVRSSDLGTPHIFLKWRASILTVRENCIVLEAKDRTVKITFGDKELPQPGSNLIELLKKIIVVHETKATPSNEGISFVDFSHFIAKIAKDSSPEDSPICILDKDIANGDTLAYYDDISYRTREPTKSQCEK